MLNCKNPQQYIKIYEETLEKHFSKEARENEDNGLMNSQVQLDRIVEEEKLDASFQSEEEKQKDQDEVRFYRNLI